MKPLKLWQIIAGSIAFLVVVVLAATVGTGGRYEDSLIETASLIRSNGLDSEAHLSVLATSWSDAISDRRDFNLAISSTQSARRERLVAMEEAHDDIVARMTSLNDPPGRFRDAHSTLLDLYEIYVQLYELAQSPSGNLQTFNATRNDLSARFSSTYARLQILLS